MSKGNGKNGHVKASATGGLGGPYSDTDRRTRTLLCRAVRWPTTSEQRKRILEKLEKAVGDAETPRDVAALARAFASIEAQNQADDHLLDKNDRIDSGQATEAHDHRTYTLSFDRSG